MAEATGETVRPQRVNELGLALDASGGARATVKGVGRSDVPRDLVAELEYRDPNGETLTAATRVALWPSRVVLGIKPDHWASSKERIKFTVLAVDPARPARQPMFASRTDAFKRETYSHRRRLIGGFYAYDHGSETRRVGDLCAGTTDAHGMLICEVAAPASGNLILRARATDGDGRCERHPCRRLGRDADEDWWFAASDNDRIDLLPEQKRYEPGDTARLQLRTPFKVATALVTVEREGVLESFVRTIDRSDPMIELPIKGSYAPNVFVSALIVRGRIADVAPTALVDLAKPAFKMGLAEIRVGWSAHELAVKVDAGAVGVQGARQGERDDRGAASRRQRAARGQRGRARGRGRRPARAPAERIVETAGRDDDPARRASGDVDRADAGDRQAALRPQGDRRGRRRRAPIGARAVRHAAAVARRACRSTRRATRPSRFR